MTRPYRDIPEPPRVSASLGHLPEWLGLMNATTVLERLLRYAEECGPLARVTLGPQKMVVVSDAELAAQVLADPRANYKGASYVLTRAVLDNVLLLNGPAWESHRALYRRALKNVDAVGAAQRVTARTVDGWLERDERMLDRDVLALVGNIVGAFVASVEVSEHFEPHRHRVQYELAAIGIDLLCQPWTFLSPKRWLDMRGSVKEARRFFRRAVDARLHRPDPSARDVLNGFIALAETGAYPKDAEAIQDGVVNFFFTAHDVLASSIGWTLHLLAQHPEIQEHLRQTLRSGGAEAEAELERVVKEGLRLFPGYGLFGRTVQEDLPLGGYWIPKGTLLIASPFVTHRLERYWPHAERFDPDRWKGKPRGTPPAAAREHYLPFGAGARACLASHLAFPIVETVVREVVMRCALKAKPGHEPGILYWGTSYPRHGMPITLRPAERPEPADRVSARRVA